MASLLEKVTSSLERVDLSKHNFRRTLESLQEAAHSLLLVTSQWKEIESYFDSTKEIIQERAKELEESIKAQSLEAETKEKDLSSRLSDFEKKEKEFHLEMEKRRGEVEQFSKELDAQARELQQEKEGIKLRRELEPLFSLVAKNMGSSSTIMLTNCSTFDLNENPTDFADDLVEQNEALARLIPSLDPAKLVLDAMEGHLNKYSEEAGDRFDSVVISFIVVLEKLMQMNPKITKEVKEQASKLGIEWTGKAKNNQNNPLFVLGCLLFLAVYDLGCATPRPVLLTLLEPFHLYDNAPKLFRLLRLENAASGVIESLKKKGAHLAVFRFICEFKLFKLFPGGPGALLLDFLKSSEKAALGISGTNNSMEAQRARMDNRKTDAVMALDYIREKKLESAFPGETLNKLTALVNDESAETTVTEPVHDKSHGKRPTATEKSKRQRLDEPGTSSQNPTGGFINVDMLRELVEKQPLEKNELYNALKGTPDPARLVLETSMALSPTNSEFKLLITSASFFSLLNQLKKLSPQVGDPVKGDAKKLAICWKEKIIKTKTDELEVVCFLLFLGIFGIVSEFKANDLLRLLDNGYWQTVSPDLCQFLGLEDAIPGFIRTLIVTGHRIKAVDYIYAFDMVHRFQPVAALINESLRITKESADKSFREAMNQSEQQVAAIDRQIKSLRAAVRCISSHKLESEFQLGDLKEQIKSLLKVRRHLLSDGSGSKPDSTIKPPNSADVDTVTTNTHLGPSRAGASSSASKPYSSAEKRGKKRSMSRNNGRSVDVASNPRNHFSGPQGQTWPVDPYRRSFTGTPNSGYDHNRSRQPVGPHLYPNYHQVNPFYRNHY